MRCSSLRSIPTRLYVARTVSTIRYNRPKSGHDVRTTLLVVRQLDLRQGMSINALRDHQMRRLIRSKCRSSRRAAMMVLIAVCLPLCLIMAAFAINVAWMQLVRTELRTATDAAARAAGRN